MSECLIVVVNRELARFFTLEPVDFPELESGPRMVNCKELENPECRMAAQDMYTDSKTGRGAAPLGGSVHGYDDKRDQHLDELRRRFAVNVIARLQRIARSKGVSTIVLTASARMRRFLYPEMDVMAKRGYEIHKLSKNMINFSPQKIHDYLAGAGMVPQKKRVPA
jgi:hypothetical protein